MDKGRLLWEQLGPLAWPPCNLRLRASLQLGPGVGVPPWLTHQSGRSPGPGSLHGWNQGRGEGTALQAGEGPGALTQKTGENIGQNCFKRCCPLSPQSRAAAPNSLVFWAKKSQKAL